MSPMPSFRYRGIFAAVPVKVFWNLDNGMFVVFKAINQTHALAALSDKTLSHYRDTMQHSLLLTLSFNANVHS